jgi:hypothetical protein
MLGPVALSFKYLTLYCIESFTFFFFGSVFWYESCTWFSSPAIHSSSVTSFFILLFNCNFWTFEFQKVMYYVMCAVLQPSTSVLNYFLVRFSHILSHSFYLFSLWLLRPCAFVFIIDDFVCPNVYWREIFQWVPLEHQLRANMKGGKKLSLQTSYCFLLREELAFLYKTDCCRVKLKLSVFDTSHVRQRFYSEILFFHWEQTSTVFKLTWKGSKTSTKLVSKKEKRIVYSHITCYQKHLIRLNSNFLNKEF